MDNNARFQPWIVALKIKNYKFAIQHIGLPRMQEFRISCHENGMGSALNSGEYIDLSSDNNLSSLIKNHLEHLLKLEEETWENLEYAEVLKQKDIIDFKFIKKDSINFYDELS